MPNTHSYNPDVLTCLANLSADEVFTPPKLANQVLDILPVALWSDASATFLDPVCKSGVFLREIAKRLNKGLAGAIPDTQTRLNHIFTKQLFGMAITELTALMSRRTLYCSTSANGRFSVCDAFDNADGHIFFPSTKHEWRNGKCTLCGANQTQYERDAALESHAYPFIHLPNFFKDDMPMKFDVIIGNPPYQMSDGGHGDSAKPIYNNFIEQAKKLNPKYLTMIVPARWYSGGKGLDDFRNSMLTDNRIKEIHDFPETSDCFPSLNIRGGICYFLWDNQYNGDCLVVNYKKNEVTSQTKRPLLEKNSEIFIRHNQSISILRKVQNLQEQTMVDYVSSRKPFGLATNFSDYESIYSEEYPIKIYRFGENGFIQKSQILRNTELIDKWKVIVAKASPGGDEYPHAIFSKPILAEPSSVCSETYIIVHAFDNEEQGENLISYISTRFFRFLVLLIKNTQDVPKKVYSFVPLQDFSMPWTDEALYAKYGLEAHEIAFIESMIRPMDIATPQGADEAVRDGNEGEGEGEVPGEGEI